ncbi:hypothetical protein, partial [Nocardioides sp.]|uniref:hypothetical protein n=1 Tax=Nocardioides sp. TaxID=35761 RepID=UPI00286D85D2
MFGAHAITTPEPDHTSVDPSPRSGRWAVTGLVLVLVAAGWFGLQMFGGDESSLASAGCTSATTTTVSMIVAPALADLVDEAVNSLADNGQCIELDVTTATVADVAAAQDEVGEGEEDTLPDLWVPDSPAWQSVLNEADHTGRTLVPALASTPVALASGVSEQAPATWLEVLSSPRLVVSDPLASGASALTMLAPFSEAAEGIGSVSVAQNAIVPVAQAFGAEVAAGQVVNDLTIDTITAGDDHLIPVTEHDLLIARRGNDALRWVVPATGAAVLNFPLVQPQAPSGGISVGSGSLDVAGRTGDRIAAWFTSEEGLAALAGDQLRGADGAPIADAEVVGE